MVAYYRGRILRHERKYAASRELATEAEKVARDLAHERLLGLILNLLAKIDTDEGDLTRARGRFDEARECFKRQKDAEMVAIVDRNKGRLAFKQGRFGEALELLERSMSGFQDLRLEVEEAEAANHHAQVLAKLGVKYIALRCAGFGCVRKMQPDASRCGPDGAFDPPPPQAVSPTTRRSASGSRRPRATAGSRSRRS